jgi:hypothetical protein
MFIFVLVCGHLEWLRICAGFDRLFIYVLSLCHYQERRVGIPLTRLILPRLCACPKPDGIVDHHYVTASNKNVDIKFSGKDAFLEYYSNLNQKERSCVQKVYVKCVYVIFGAINCE